MSTTRHLHLVLATATLLLGCGGTEDGPGTVPTAPEPEPWVNQQPVVQVASPGEMAVGDVLTVLGQNFVDAAHGRVLIALKGTYFDDQGGTTAVDYQGTPKVKNSGKLTWELLPNIVFDKTGDHLGKFVGNLIVLNQGNDGSQQFSDPMPITIQVKPSLIPRLARPSGTSCGSIVSDTLENLPMAFTVEAVGLRPASKDNPITFYWTFLAEQWKVSFSYGTMDPSSIVPKKGAFMVEDVVETGTTSSVADGGPRNFLLKVGSDILGTTSLKELKTGAIAEQGNNMPISVNVAAVDSTGKSAKIAINLIIHRKADMSYDGTSQIAERFPPTLVSDCIPGGDIGRDVSYHEGSSESRSRSLSFNWNASLGVNVAPIPSNPFMMGINFSVGFGMNIHEQVSSDRSKSLALNGHILPGQYAAFYRQTTKVYRIAKLMGYTECGQSFHLGDAILTDWLYTPDMASGPSCMPASKLPPAQKFLD
jgi:hypothetical protein